MRNVPVGLAEHGYCIRIDAGSLVRIGDWVRECDVASPPLVVTDQNVNNRYASILSASFREAGLCEPRFVVLPPGERTKSLAVLESLYTEAIQFGMDRKSCFIAFGGGVIGDLTGFAAATYLRGVPFLQVPTTLLAQVDSSVGGKVAINHPLGKNLIGSFYQPAGVLIDPTVLDTLPDREYVSGLAEVLKYGFIADMPFLNALRAKRREILDKDPETLEWMIARCCEIKASFVELDEKETGIRILLNFGHTVGHAIETAGGYEQFSHGEAVSVGMVAAARIGCKMGWTSETDARLVEDTLVEFGLPTSVGSFAADALTGYMGTDKKREAGKIRWVLLRSIGDAEACSEVPPVLVKEILDVMKNS